MDTQSQPFRWRPLLGDVALILVIVLLALKMSYRIDQVRDVRLSDEVHYLASGCFLPERGLPSAAFSPLYSVWYFVLSWFEPDRVRLYDLNWAVLACLVPVSFYLGVRALGGPRIVGLIAAFVLLSGNLLDIWPYPAHLASAVLLLGVALATRVTLPWRGAVLALTLLVAAFIRPEWFLAFLLCSAALVVLAVVQLRRDLGAWVRWAGPASVVAGAAAACLGTFGSPTSSSRSWTAFSQHYAANVSVVESSTLHPMTHYAKYVEKDFGAAQSVREALAANPGALAWHVGVNLRRLPSVISTMLRGSYELPRPYRNAVAALTLVLFAGGLWGLWRGFRTTPDTPSFYAPRTTALVLLLLLLGPALAAALLVQPRDHYLMPAVLLASALVWSGWGNLAVPNPFSAGRARLLPSREPAEICRSAALLAIALLALLPSRAYHWNIAALLTARTVERPYPLFERATIAALRDLDLPAPVRILEDGYSRALFTGLPFDEPSWMRHRAQDGLHHFLTRHDINVVVLTPVLCAEQRFHDDPQFQAFRTGHDTSDFTFVPVPGIDATIAVRHP